jgi:lipoate-protein ligase B
MQKPQWPVEVELRRHCLGQPWTYADLDQRQRQIADRVRLGDRGVLLVSEVAPVITLGRRTPETDIIVKKAYLEERGISVHRTDRGGLATYHGPGQWVVFVVDRLERITGDRRGVRLAVNGLLDVGREVGAQYDSTAKIHSGPEAGVWSARGKFAAVGVHVEDGVLLHGLAINGFKTLTSFFGLRPCGLDAPVSYLLEANKESCDVAFDKLGERIVDSVFRHFWGAEIEELTGIRTRGYR